ncbi:Protein CBG25199 [Caenorhabditis briggsae]|uniref:Protein CBG25199 n=1 Tax=Caenorhabditis briggsae TaxID=6238 RepID=B6IJF8_CAEBR|nr:Protein CBG25199 [Caenorhabditis briggsae]CAS00038.1 Protein CBG25199 [Caenorhabditis briggsae]
MEISELKLHICSDLLLEGLGKVEETSIIWKKFSKILKTSEETKQSKNSKFSEKSENSKNLKKFEKAEF